MWSSVRSPEVLESCVERDGMQLCRRERVRSSVRSGMSSGSRVVVCMRNVCSFARYDRQPTGPKRSSPADRPAGKGVVVERVGREGLNGARD